MLNRKDFFEYIKNNVKDYLPPSYDSASIDIRQVTKNNDMQLNAIIIKKENEQIVPTIYMDPLYRAYRNGKALDACVSGIADMRIEHEGVKLDLPLQDLQNYEKVKDKLQVRICDPETNGERLQGKAVTMHGDFAAYYAVDIGEISDGTGSIIVSEALREEWGVSIDQLHSDALLAEQKREPTLMSMDDMIQEMMYGGSPANLLIGDQSEVSMYQPMFCLTNGEKLNGASLILQEDVMKRIGEVVRCDYFVLPSSIHETLIVPDNGSMELPELSAMVKEVNATQVAPEERLSDKVQHYDRVSGVLENAEKREMRLAREKEEKLETKANQKTAGKRLHTRLAEAKTEVKIAAQAKGKIKSNVKSQEASL